MTTKVPKVETTTKEEQEPKKARVYGKPWPKGVSGNPAGRPPGTHDPVKELGRRIADSPILALVPEKQRKRMKRLGLLTNEDITVIETMIIDLATSRDHAKQAMFLDRVYGKVPNVNLNQNADFDWTKYVDKFTDEELERIKQGESPLDILIGKIPDAA